MRKGWDRLLIEPKDIALLIVGVAIAAAFLAVVIYVATLSIMHIVRRYFIKRRSRARKGYIA